jgi:hypothetical protein
MLTQDHPIMAMVHAPLGRTRESSGTPGSAVEIEDGMNA